MREVDMPPVVMPALDSLPGLLAKRARSSPDDVALVAPGRRPLTFDGLQRAASEVAGLLNARGLGRGDRVALVLPNSPEAAVAFLTVAAATTCAPLNPAYRAAELAFYLEDLRADAVVVASDLDSPVRAVAAERGIPVIELEPRAGPAGIFNLTGAGPDRSASTGPARPEDVALLLHTSGTTSRPKLVPLTHANLSASAAHIVATLQLTPRDRCLNVMPLFHIHGLIGVLLSSVAAGASVVCLPVFTPEAFFDALEAYRSTWYSAVPTIHQALVAHAEQCPELSGRYPLRLIRSGSSALPPTVLHGLERVFQGPVIESYGMTEAAHQICSNPLPPRVRKAGSVGPAAGPEIAILDEQGRPLRPGEIGEVAIRGANIFAGYERAPEANAAAFVDGWFRTGDQGVIDDDGYLALTGRLKELINRGGEKIAPREVDEVLLIHPAVAQAVTFAVPHPTLGEEIAAAVVPRPGATVTEQEIRAFAAARLTDAKVPRRVLVLDELPKGATGKLVRIGLAERLGLAPGTANESQQPIRADESRTPAEMAVAELWTQMLGSEPESIDEDFFLAGGDSISAARLIARLRERWGIAVSLRDLFAAPTVAGLAARLETNGMNDRSHDFVMPTRLSPSSGSRPLSPAQSRIWFFDQLLPGSPVYHVPHALRLRGPLDATALERALGEIVRRHEALRTGIRLDDDGQPTQIIGLETPVALPLVDLRNLVPSERATVVSRRLIEEARRPFDLTQGPLLRALLLQITDDEHVLLVTVHHIAFDGWSRDVLDRELGTLYAAFAAGQPPPLPELPLQYADAALRQRDRLHGDALETQLAYWRRQLANAPTVLELPADHPRPATQSYRGAKHVFTLPPVLVDRLRAVSRREHVTLFMTLLAAFQVLLQRYTGQDDLLVGTPIAGRTRTDVEGLIGCFINMLALRADLADNPTFREMLRRVRATALAAYDHQDLPFERLVAELKPQRDWSHHPLFQVLFVLENAPTEPLALPGLTVEAIEVDAGTSKVDLSLLLTETAGGLDGHWEYSTDLFAAATIERMADHFRTLLEGIVADPEQPISAVPFLTDAERHQLLVAWNDTAIPYPHQRCLHELVEAQVDRTPEAVAVVFQGESLTYRQLNARANQLAHHLRARGVGPEKLVGLCLERSLDLVVALLGILKAGGAYVPLDPSYPRARLEFMLRDSGARVLVTETALRERLPAEGVQVVCRDAERAVIAAEPEGNLASGATPDNLAYVIYTSGSTGQPKGVEIRHQSVVNLCSTQNRDPDLTTRDVILAIGPVSFDIAVPELLLPLVWGMRVVVASRAVATDGVRLAETLRTSGATVLQATPATWQMLLAAGWPGDSGLWAIAAGEALSRSLARQLLDRSRALWNKYGPTETTVYAAVYRVTGDERSGTIPIGRPVANARTYILDKRLQPVPIGVPGELYLGGDGLARGYHARPDLTAARFIPDPFAADPHARLYTTGDLARYLPDGSIAFLGRRDHQVKLRGYRIELGEIEATLLGHPEVREAVVVLHEAAPDDQRLVAYVVPRPGPRPSTAELRGHLRTTLPDYMVPSAVMLLPALPLSPSGKVDRSALPAPDWATVTQADAFVAPRDATEAKLTEIWENLLGVRPIGIHDDFFDLGGYSLLAMRLITLIQQAFGRDLPLSALFPAPTIAHVAGLLRDEAATRRSSVLVPIQPEGTRPPFFCVHSVEGDILRFTSLPRYLGPDQPTYGLRAHGLDGDEEPLSDVPEIAADYIAQVRTIQPTGPYYLGGFSGGGTIAFEMAQQLQRNGDEVALLAVIDHTPIVPRHARARGTALRVTPPQLLRYLRGTGSYCLSILRGDADERRAWLRSLWTTGHDWAVLTTHRDHFEASPVRDAPWRIWWLVDHLPERHRRVAEEHYRAMADYVPRPYPGRVTLLKTAPPRPALKPGDPEQIWRDLAEGGVEVRLISGRHGEIFDEPHVAVLGRELRAALEAAQRDAARSVSAPVAG